MSQNCKLEIIINNISDEKAQVVKNSLAPDNIDFPDGLLMKVEKIETNLSLVFQTVVIWGN